MATKARVTPNIIRRKEVEARTGLARSTIYEYMAEGIFPRQVQLGKQDPDSDKKKAPGKTAVGWLDSEVDAWILSRKKVQGSGK